MGGRILVVDDDESVRAVIGVLLERDHEVVLVSDGASALAAIEAHDFDVALLDYELPDMKGTEVGFVLRRRSPLVKVIVFSAVQESANKIDPIWADVFLSKTDVGELPKVVEKVIRWNPESDAWLMSSPRRWPTPRYLPLRRNGNGAVTGFLRSLGDSTAPVVYLLSEWPVPEGYFGRSTPHYDYGDFEMLVADGWRVASSLSSSELRDRRSGARSSR